MALFISKRAYGDCINEEKQKSNTFSCRLKQKNLSPKKNNQMGLILNGIVFMGSKSKSKNLMIRLNFTLS